MMNDMPERIWASNLFDTWVSNPSESCNGEDTEYIRADLTYEEKRELVEALKSAEQFIINGIRFGFIRMPDKDSTRHRPR